MKAVILAAGMGTRLESVSGGIPKCMVKVAGIPLIDRLLERIGQTTITQVVIVTGHKADDLKAHIKSLSHPLAQSAILVHNDRYSDRGNFYSLLVAEKALHGESFVKLDGDVLMDERVLPILLACPGPAVLAVDCRDGLGEEEMKVQWNEKREFLALNKQLDPSKAVGEYIGVDRVDADVSEKVFDKLREMITLGETDGYYERAYELLMQSGMHYELADVTGCQWTEIDDEADLKFAEELLTKS